MAVVNIKSSLITNADATPVVLSNPYTAFGGDVTETSSVTVGATDSATSTYRVCLLPSSAMLTDLRIMNETSMTTGTSYKFGVLFNTVDGGAVVVANSDLIFASAISLVTTRSIWTSIYFPSILNAGGLSANTTLRIWELLGFTTDTFKMYHLAVTAVTAATVGGNLAVQVSYTR